MRSEPTIFPSKCGSFSSVIIVLTGSIQVCIKCRYLMKFFKVLYLFRIKNTGRYPVFVACNEVFLHSHQHQVLFSFFALSSLQFAWQYLCHDARLRMPSFLQSDRLKWYNSWHGSMAWTLRRSTEKPYTPLTCSLSEQGYAKGILKLAVFFWHIMQRLQSNSMLSGHTLKAHYYYNIYRSILSYKSINR